MRIVLITSYPPSGGTLNEYAYHFVQSLRKKPEVDEVVLLVDELPTDSGMVYTDEEGTAGRAALRFVPCWRFDALTNLPRIVQAARAAKPDVVLFNIQFASFGSSKAAAALGLLAPLLLKLMCLPTVVLLHNIMETVDLESAGYAGNPLMGRIVRLFGTIVTWLVLRADRVALTIPKYVEILRTKYRANNVLLMPHGTFEIVEAQPASKRNIEALQVMTFGKFGTYKRVETLIEAVQQLSTPARPPIELVIAGTDSPNCRGYLAAMQTRYSNLPNVRYTGYVAEEDVPDTFQAADVVVFPYTSTTGSSGVLHQAGSYARATALPHIGDLAEIIREEGYDGAFFEPDNVESMAAAIASLLDDPQRRYELGQRNFLAAQGLPLDDVVDWYVLHIENMLQSRIVRRVRRPLRLRRAYVQRAFAATDYSTLEGANA